MAATTTDDRLIRLEMALAHTQHDLEQMNTVLLSLQTELKTYRQQIAGLERRLQQMDESTEIRDPGEEMPPHY